MSDYLANDFKKENVLGREDQWITTTTVYIRNIYFIVDY